MRESFFDTLIKLAEKDKDITSYIIVFRKTDGKELKVSEKNKIINAINEIVKERQETGKRKKTGTEVPRLLQGV